MEGPEKLPEKLPGPDRIVGTDEFSEERVQLLFTEIIRNQKIELFEREKTLEERKIFYAIIEKIPDFVKEYGAERIKFLLEDQFHILDGSKQDFEQVQQFLEDGIGGTYSLDGRIDVLSENGEYLQIAHRLVHELMHANSFDSFTIKGHSSERGNASDIPLTRTVDGHEEKLSLARRRFGLEVFEKGERKLFKYLNEAVTEELTRRFCERYFPDINYINEEFEKYRFGNQYVRESNNVTVNGTMEEIQKPSSLYSYSKERFILGEFIQELYQNNGDSFESPEEIFKIFSRAMFTGKLLELARLIEKRGGKGSFRKMGEVDPDLVLQTIFDFYKKNGLNLKEEL